MNPFSIREALLAKHAQHVVLIHFPIAMFAAGVAFFIVVIELGTITWIRHKYMDTLTASAARLCF